MSHPRHWLKITNEGLFCEPGGFHIDPIMPVSKALITHAHSDHARPGHDAVLATEETLAIMAVRYGDAHTQTEQKAKYTETVKINDVKVTFIPAGHILGSAQILLEYKGARAIFSGDYKRHVDPTCEAFVVSSCDVFITEATFGLPIFRHPPIEEELTKLLHSLKIFSNRCHLLSAYTLGKCQRILKTLRLMGYQKPIYLHGAMQKLCDIYSKFGQSFGNLVLVDDENAAKLEGEIVICPPGALHDRWSRKLPNVITAHASGWMQIRARAKQLGVELPLVISDHADWPALLQTITEVEAPEIWITHGNEEALSYYAISKGIKAKALTGLHYEDEDESA